MHIFCGSQRRLVKAGALPLSASFQGSSVGFQAWQKAQLAAEPSHWPRFKYFPPVLRFNYKRLIGHFIFTSQNQNDVALSREGRIPWATQEERQWVDSLAAWSYKGLRNFGWVQSWVLCVCRVFQSTDVFLLAGTAVWLVHILSVFCRQWNSPYLKLKLITG